MAASENNQVQVQEQDANVQHEMRANPVRNVAVVGLRNGDGRLLMIRTRRLPGRWQPIGGGMDPEDKNPIDTLQREVQEETGVELSRDELRAVLETPYDFGEGTIYFFEANIGPRTNSIVFDETEILEHRWVSLDEAFRLAVFPATERFLEALVKAG